MNDVSFKSFSEGKRMIMQYKSLVEKLKSENSQLKEQLQTARDGLQSIADTKVGINRKWVSCPTCGSDETARFYLKELEELDKLMQQTIKCKICGDLYKFYSHTVADQSGCPKCVAEAERNMRGKLPDYFQRFLEHVEKIPLKNESGV